MNHLVLFLTFAVFSGVLPRVADAQSTTPAGRRAIAAIRLGESDTIRLDGRLDEEAWRRAIPAADFMQIDPSNGTPATEPTEVRIIFGREALYMGITCYDSEPDKWLGYQRRRDEFLSSDDRFMWAIDTFSNGQSGYYFEMNPSGLMADSLMGGGIDNRQWDGIWNARVNRSDIGWTVEVEIPFRSLNFDPNNESWGINFQRTVRRKNEESIWMGWARNQGLRRMTNTGLLTGIRDVSQGHGLDVKPYGLVSGQSGQSGAKFSRDQNAGMDVFYSPTPGLRTVFTLNTDFAQTEVDQRQVNLTRFSLFFPEKRDFFLDGAPFFAFGSPLSGDLIVNPFFSRRIGLTTAGTPQTINFGTKLTGQVGRQDVGLLHVRTGDGDSVNVVGEDFAVARVRRRVLAQSYVGGIYTRRDSHALGADTRQTAGLDFRLATSRFLGSQNFETSAYYLYATNPEADPGASFGASVALPNDPWNIQVFTREIGTNFDPAIGFVTRRGYRRYQPSVEYGPRPRANKYVRRLAFGANLDVQTDLANQLLTRGVDFKLIDVNFHSQESFSATLSPTTERLDEAFTISRGITLPAGQEYSFTRINVSGQTANRRVLALNGSFETGGFYSGTRQTISASLTVRARPGVIVYSTAEWNAVDLPEGSFQTRLYRLVGETQFSPWIALVNNFQYDSVSRVLGWQSRFRWILRPGSDVYVVYTHNWQDDPILERFTSLDRRIASKVLYTHRF